ncbi:hypothetical protein L6R52_26635, partial [Myxococcota bacterium]|nr:hypothetical protein [Myxococcota bacterium]
DAPAEATTPTRPATEATPDRAQALIVRAKALRARVGAGSDGEAQVAAIIRRLLMEASSTEADGAAARVDKLEAELAALERSLAP